MIPIFFTLISFLNSMKKMRERATEEIRKELSSKDQVKKDEETLHTIMSTGGSVVNNKF